MKRIWLGVLGTLLLACGLAAETVEKIVIEGNRKVSRETVLFYMKTQEGMEYSPERIREDFRLLWDTGFFANVVISADDGEKGKVVKVALEENKVVADVVYKITKKIKESDITEKLQGKNVSILPASYYSPLKLKKVERVIQAMLEEKGYGNGRVWTEEIEQKGQMLLTIHVEPGSKTRVGRVDFPGLEGNRVSAGFLTRGLKNNQVHSFLSGILSKDVYNKEKLEEDLEEVRLRLQQKGYLEAKVGRPETRLITRKSVFGPVQKMMALTIPVEMGPQYRLGTIKVEGNKIIRGEYLQTLIKMKRGALYNIKTRNKGIEAIQKLYGGLGYFYCQVAPVENLDPEKKIADLTINVQENEICYLGKLEFSGNTFTKDHVIRREWFLREGRRLNINALEDSVRRMKQLGLVTMDKMPEIKPDAKDPTRINITAEVKEVNRQSINFNVGYSGYDGFFIAAGYSTQNFLGMGEAFTLNMQTGTRTQNYQLAFTEPYLFNLPANAGINVFKTTSQYPGLYTQRSAGFNVSTSARFWRYFGANLVYSFENVEITDVDPDYQFANPYWSYYYSVGQRHVSSILPSVSYSTVDSPIFPRSGTKYQLSYRYSGGFLGGDVNVQRYEAEFVKFVPIWYRHVLGFHVVYNRIRSFGGKEIPFYERIFLGGERSIRGFDIYQIGPRDAKGTVFGGNKAFYLNLEYQIPLNENFAFVFFSDIGNSYDNDTKISLKNLYSSHGLELKVFVPMLNVPFRLIFAYNPRLLRPDDKHFVFRFAVGPSFY